MNRASTEKVSVIGLDLAKRRLQALGARAHGGVAFRKKLSGDKALAFLAEHPRCVVTMEACGSAHLGDAPSARSAMKFG
jgi:transposase